MKKSTRNQNLHHPNGNNPAKTSSESVNTQISLLQETSTTELEQDARLPNYNMGITKSQNESVMREEDTRGYPSPSSDEPVSSFQKADQAFPAISHRILDNKRILPAQLQNIIVERSSSPLSLTSDDDINDRTKKKINRKNRLKGKQPQPPPAPSQDTERLAEVPDIIEKSNVKGVFYRKCDLAWAAQWTFRTRNGECKTALRLFHVLRWGYLRAKYMAEEERKIKEKEGIALRNIHESSFPGIFLQNRGNSWRAVWMSKKEGMRIEKSFMASEVGLEQAKQFAINCWLDLEEGSTGWDYERTTDGDAVPEVIEKSKIAGVYWKKRDFEWEAQWRYRTDDNKYKTLSKSFAAVRYGYLGAKALAEEERQEKESCRLGIKDVYESRFPSVCIQNTGDNWCAFWRSKVDGEKKKISVSIEENGLLDSKKQVIAKWLEEEQEHWTEEDNIISEDLLPEILRKPKRRFVYVKDETDVIPEVIEKSKVTGVYWKKRDRAWEAQWRVVTEDGKFRTASKSFHVSKCGFLGAKLLAENERTQKTQDRLGATSIPNKRRSAADSAKSNRNV